VNLFAVRLTACLVCVACFGISSQAARDASSIRQQVRETGSFERMIVATDRQLQLADLVGQADLVIEASTPGGRSFLDKAETGIYTDYTFKVQALIKNRRPGLRVGHALTVRRESGTVQIDGRPATIIENDFPSFGAHEPYILFLKLQPRDNVYTVLGGAQGAFSAGDTVMSVAAGLPDAAGPSLSASRDAFLGEVRALLKFME